MFLLPVQWSRNQTSEHLQKGMLHKYYFDVTTASVLVFCHAVFFRLQTLKLEKRWCVRSESEELLQGLLTWVKSQWETMFGVKLHTEEAT